MKKENQKGVSLVELIVVMAILAILAGVAFIGYTAFIKRAKVLKAEQELIQVYNLIYMSANERTIEIGQNKSLATSLFVTTDKNKIVLMFNDLPSELTDYGSDGFDFNNINHWENEDLWNELLRDLIDEVTGDIKMFSGRFELDPVEKTAESLENGQVAIIEKRNITYILENNEELRQKKELVVMTVNDVETITEFLRDLETTRGVLVPEGRANKDENEVEEISYELWFIWTAAGSMIKNDNNAFFDDLEGTLNFSYNIILENPNLTAEELLAANRLINGITLNEDGSEFYLPSRELFKINVEYEDIDNKITTNFATYLTFKLSFNREPFNKEEYMLIQEGNIKLEFIINITDISLLQEGP